MRPIDADNVAESVTDARREGASGVAAEPHGVPAAKRIPVQTVERLSDYRRVLEELDRRGVEHVHSQQLADLVGVTSAQLRRDLASFGSFGNISRGYNVFQLTRTIARILGTDAMQTLALIGLGDLGRALLSYRGFEERGFHIAAAFDVDTDKIGRVFAGRRCYGLHDLEAVIADNEIRIAILASRPEGLQELVERLGAAGVRSFLNLVPKGLRPPHDCHVETVDISAKLEKLSFLAGRPAERATP
jgi:redox-sensing transcriptional repressor